MSRASAIAARIRRALPHKVLSAYWTRSGDATERVWKLGPLPIHVFRRVEDQRWSPTYTERRIERGILLGNLIGTRKNTAISFVTNAGYFVGQKKAVTPWDTIRPDAPPDLGTFS